MGNNDILRELAKQYAEIANSDQNHLNIILHRKANDLKPSRPALLIDEIPWQEMNIENELTLVSDDPILQTVEQYMRQTIYKWNHMRADMVVPPYIGVQKIIHSTGIGITPKHDGAYHETHGDVQNVQYVNQLNTEEDLEKLHNEIIAWDETETRKRFEQIAETIGDIIPVKITGEATGYLLGCRTKRAGNKTCPLFFKLIKWETSKSFVMMSAGMPFALSMVMMAALYRRIMNQSAGQVIRNRRLNIARSARDQFNPIRLKGGLRPSADSAADEKGDSLLLQDHRQCLMAAHGSIQVFSCRHLSVFNGEEFKHFCVAEVLEHLAVFRCYCKFHF